MKYYVGLVGPAGALWYFQDWDEGGYPRFGPERRVMEGAEASAIARKMRERGYRGAFVHTAPEENAP